MDLAKAVVDYRDVKTRGILPNPVTYTNLLSLTAGFGDQGSGSYPLRAIDPPHNFEVAFEVFSDMKAGDVEIHEASYTALIRCCCMNARPAEALVLYRELQAKNLTPKVSDDLTVRVYIPHITAL